MRWLEYEKNKIIIKQIIVKSLPKEVIKSEKIIIDEFGKIHIKDDAKA